MKRLEDTELYKKIDMGKTSTKDGAMHGYPTVNRPDREIIQYSNYSSFDSEIKPVPDNNPFWENGNNPLSSKGN